MTRITAMIIQDDPNVYVSAFGPLPSGEFGLYIGTFSESPSGCMRPRHLLQSEGGYKTAEDAVTAGNLIIEEVKAKGELIWN